MLNEQAQIDTCGQEFIAKLSSSLYLALIFFKVPKNMIRLQFFSKRPSYVWKLFLSSNVN